MSKKVHAGKTKIYVVLGLSVKKVALKSEASLEEFYKMLFTIFQNLH